MLWILVQVYNNNTKYSKRETTPPSKKNNNKQTNKPTTSLYVCESPPPPDRIMHCMINWWLLRIHPCNESQRPIKRVMFLLEYLHKESSDNLWYERHFGARKFLYYATFLFMHAVNLRPLNIKILSAIVEPNFGPLMSLLSLSRYSSFFVAATPSMASICQSEEALA